ncbi:hypothetical protein [Sneathiella limimaris]|uniref:hypothetical protein n=1 Tax=Sneathiella limimaris TaxID=1964213 RepID=UPI00146F0838|nr:hypothetical protein [Sneathiella limimaris]
MAIIILSKEKQAIAQNLIETCGLERAFHAAKQYGWHDIATSIREKLSAAEVSKLKH